MNSKRPPRSARVVLLLSATKMFQSIEKPNSKALLQERAPSNKKVIGTSSNKNGAIIICVRAHWLTCTSHQKVFTGILNLSIVDGYGFSEGIDLLRSCLMGSLGHTAYWRDDYCARNNIAGSSKRRRKAENIGSTGRVFFFIATFQIWQEACDQLKNAQFSSQNYKNVSEYKQKRIDKLLDSSNPNDKIEIKNSNGAISGNTFTSSNGGQVFFSANNSGVSIVGATNQIAPGAINTSTVTAQTYIASAIMTVTNNVTNIVGIPSEKLKRINSEFSIITDLLGQSAFSQAYSRASNVIKVIDQESEIPFPDDMRGIAYFLAARSLEGESINSESAYEFAKKAQIFWGNKIVLCEIAVTAYNLAKLNTNDFPNSLVLVREAINLDKTNPYYLDNYIGSNNVTKFYMQASFYASKLHLTEEALKYAEIAISRVASDETIGTEYMVLLDAGKTNEANALSNNWSIAKAIKKKTSEDGK